MPTYYATYKSTNTSTYCAANITTYCAAFCNSQWNTNRSTYYAAFHKPFTTAYITPHCATNHTTLSQAYVTAIHDAIIATIRCLHPPCKTNLSALVLHRFYIRLVRDI